MTPEPTDKPAGAGEPPGVRIGPMVFVGGLRSSPDDPWAHRKGEPRPLALMWAVYISVSAGLTIFAVSFLTVPSHDQFAYACRALFVMLAIGACVLWPMVRLSQQFPRRPIRSVLVDLLIVIIPVQAVLWPMPMLTRWSWEINGAIASNLVAWSTLAAALLALGYTVNGHLARAFSTGACLAAIIAAPAALVLTNAPRIVLWLSPLTSVFQITSAPPAIAPRMTGPEWALTLAPLAPALLLFVLAGILHASGQGDADTAADAR